MGIKKIKGQMKDEANKALENIKSIGNASKREIYETYLASEILLKLSTGDDVSEEQITFLKEQSIDVAKALTLIGLQAIPGSSVAIIILEKLGEKHGFTLFPKAHKNSDTK
ncbi:MAG: hypothetical protein ABI448_07360 [Bacteroidia bacterium]